MNAVSQSKELLVEIRSECKRDLHVFVHIYLSHGSTHSSNHEMLRHHTFYGGMMTNLVFTSYKCYIIINVKYNSKHYL